MKFLGIERHSRPRPHHHYLSGIFTIVIIFFGVGFYQIGQVFFLKSQNPITNFHETVQNLAVVQGGDIHIEPPAAPEPPRLPELRGTFPAEDDFSAVSVFVKDVETGSVLFEKNPYESRPIASLTKLMSALVLLERTPEWATSTQVVSDDLIDTHMYAGDTYTLKELWDASLIASSNKAIMTLADAVGWNRPAFIARMNQKATELGMGNSVFLEPTGLNEANRSTASDLSILLHEALQHDTIRESLATEEYNLYSEERDSSHHLWNTDWLLLGWIPNTLAHIVGGKTGYIPAAGYNFMMETEDAMGHRISVVVLGAHSHEARFTEARDAAEAVYEAYVWPDEPEYDQVTE